MGEWTRVKQCNLYINHMWKAAKINKGFQDILNVNFIYILLETISLKLPVAVEQNT